MLGGGQLGRYARRRRPPDGLRHDRARPRPRRAGRRASPTTTSWRRTTIRPPSTAWPSDVRRRHDRVREPAGAALRAAGRRRRRRPAGRPPWRSPRTASPRSASSPASACRRRRSPSPAANVAGRLPGDRQDRPPRLRRQGPARGRRRRRARRRRRPSSASPCVVEQRVPLDVELSVLVARTADGRHGRRTRSPRTTTSTASSTSPSCRPGSTGARGRRRGRAGARHRRGARLRRRAGRRAVRQRRPAARQRAGAPPPQQRPLDARRVARRASSSSRCGRCAAWPSGRPTLDGGGAVAMVNLLGDLWAGGEPRLGRRARRARRPAPPLRQVGGPARPQDGPPHGARRRRGRRRRPGRRAARPRSHADADGLADEVGHAAGDEHDQHLADRSSARSTGRRGGRSAAPTTAAATTPMSTDADGRRRARSPSPATG